MHHIDPIQQRINYNQIIDCMALCECYFKFSSVGPL